MKNLPVKKPVVFCGGVTQNTGMERAIREVFKLEKGELEVPNDALYSAAAGAALHADGRLGSDGKCNLEKAGTDAKYREQMLFSCGELIEALRRAEERKQMQRSLLPRLVLAEGPVSMSRK